MSRQERFMAAQLQFIGEQDGSPERELKTRLIQLFGDDRNLVKAYLARVVYEDSQSVTVALCLRSQGSPDPQLVETVGKVFASMFVGCEHLDVIFLTDAQEAELAKCCEPFFAMVHH